MHLIVIGINFKTADVAIREKFNFSNDEIAGALDCLNKYSTVKGSVILSTCNRVEIYASVSDVEKGADEIVEFMSTFHKIPIDSLLPVVYKKNCQHAVVHLFKVVSSLDSMLLGEYQIQGQVRDAYIKAKENRSTNSMLNKVFQTAIQIGKKVRSETKIGDGSVSVANLAIEMVKQVFENHENLNVLFIGAGKISKLTATYFQQQFKNCNITVTNRSDASELAKSIAGKSIEYAQRFDAIIDNEVIIASTSAPNYIVCKHEINLMQELLQGKTRIFIDLSIPRNIDPEINEIENCFVYSIDDINRLIDLNIDKRSLHIDKAEKIIQEISEDYFKWYFKQFIMPTMLDLRDKLLVLKQNSIDQHQPFVSKLDESQKKDLNVLLDAYSNSIIKIIMGNLQHVTTKEDLISISKTLKKSFTLDIKDNE